MYTRLEEEFWLSYTSRRKQNASFCAHTHKHTLPRIGESNSLSSFHSPSISICVTWQNSMFRLCRLFSFLAIIFLSFSSIVACCFAMSFSGCCHNTYSYLPWHVIDFLAQLLHFTFILHRLPIVFSHFFPSYLIIPRRNPYGVTLAFIPNENVNVYKARPEI